MLTYTSTTHALAKWTVVVYVQASNSLNNFAGKNFADMATVGSTADTNVLIQWYKPGHEGIWRYKVEKGHLSLDSHLKINTDGSSAKDLIDAMTWAVKKYPAENYGLILWNHGVGILDPVWGESIMKVSAHRVKDNPRAVIEGITQTIPSHLEPEEFDSLETIGYRGILFNERTQTYMDNQALIFALETIKNSLLKGKKLKLLGMDACLMQMAEVCYQVRNYADLLIASQEVELASGWNYAHFLNALTQTNNTPAQIAQSVVSGYESTYKNKIQFYTQSAVDLDFMDDIKNGLDLTIACINDCKLIPESNIMAIIKKSRESALQFSATTYIDLYSFYSELRRNLNTSFNTGKAQSSNRNLLQKITELREVIEINMQLLEKSIIANTAGKYLARAKGLSIYFPYNEKIDNSYKKCLFGQESLWLSFLELFSYKKA